jgi:hypothetical protein
MRSIRPLALIVLLSAFSGCPACDESGDTTPPTVTATNPAAGAEGVLADVVVTATFSEEMDAATITESSFLVRSGVTPVAGAVAWNAATNTAGFTPAAALAAGTTYTATITTDAADTAGNHLAADYTWTFDTAVPVGWEQVGGQLSPGDAESEDPEMLLLGDVPAVGYRHGSFQAHLVRWNGTAWAAPETDPTGGEMNASIYGTPSWCAQGTTVHLAWSMAGDAAASDDTFYDRIFAEDWTEAGGWTTRNGGAELSTVWNDTYGGANAWEPAIACPPIGDPLVAWVESDVVADPDSEDGAWISEVGTASATRSPILSRNDTAGSYATAVRTVGLEVNGIGDMYLAQWESDETNQDLTELYVTQWDGTTFAPLGGAVSQDYDYNNLCVPSIAVLEGDVSIAYSEANATDYTKQVFVKRWRGGTWETMGGGPVSGFPAGEHYDSANPDLVAAEGALWLTWNESDNSTGTYIFVARFDGTSGTWELIGDRINVDPSRVALDPTLAIRPGAYVYVAFEEVVDGWEQIFVKRHPLPLGE